MWKEKEVEHIVWNAVLEPNSYRPTNNNLMFYLLFLETSRNVSFIILMYRVTNRTTEQILAWISVICFFGHPLAAPEAVKKLDVAPEAKSSSTLFLTNHAHVLLCSSKYIWNVTRITFLKST